MPTITSPDLTTLNIPRVEKVIAWLESGEHRKGQGCLGQLPGLVLAPGEVLDLPELPPGDHLFCCLGGMCEVAIAAGLELERTATWSGITAIWYDGEDSILPPAVREFYGLTDDNPPIQRSDGLWRKAASWNDYGEFGQADNTVIESDFTQIAQGFRRMVAEARRQQGLENS